MRIARSTGVAGGVLIALLGIWGALIPFVGAYFNYSFGVNSTWHYTTDRLWLDVVPGAVALIAGLLLLLARTRTTAALGAWLAIFAGAWFVVGPPVSLTWEHGAGPIGAPLYGTTRQMLELMGYFYLLGLVIVALAAFVLGRLVPARALAPTPAVGGERVRTPARAGTEPSTTPATPAHPTDAPAQPGRRRLHVSFSRGQPTRS